MMEAVGDVEIQDTANQTTNFLLNIAGGHTDPCIGERLMLSYAKRHRWL